MSHDLHGLSATPGTFAFSEVQLERGGTIRVRVTLLGKPAPGAACRVLELRPCKRSGAGEHPLSVRGEGRPGTGTCTAQRLPSGSYTVEVALSEREARVEREAAVGGGDVTELAVDLAPIG